MEVRHMIMISVMLLISGGMAYLIGDFHGYLKGMDKAREIYSNSWTSLKNDDK